MSGYPITDGTRTQLVSRQRAAHPPTGWRAGEAPQRRPRRAPVLDGPAPTTDAPTTGSGDSTDDKE